MGFAFENHGHGPVAIDRDPHFGAKHAGGHRQSATTCRIDETVEKRPSLGGRRCPRKVGLCALAEPTGDGEIGDQQKLGAFVAEAAVETAVGCRQQAKVSELASQPGDLAEAVAALNGDEGDQAAADFSDDPIIDKDRGGCSALNDGSHGREGAPFRQRGPGVTISYPMGEGGAEAVSYHVGMDRRLSPLDAELAAALDGLEARSRLRVLREIGGPQGRQVDSAGRPMLLACSNDYLGLAGDPRLAAAATEAMARWGFGAGASRLISGSMTAHHALEAEIAKWKGSEAALLFNSGWHANVGTIAALVGPGDVVYSDALNHASLIDGCRLSRATVRVWPHADVRALDAMLAADAGAGGRRLVVTDSVFSMEGDEAPLEAIVEICERHGAALMVDEAHATGLLGPEGQGLVAEIGLQDRVAVQMGTLGKALGSFGAYVAGSRILIDWLINRARSFVFTTALPPAVAAASGAAIRIVAEEPERRQKALANAADLRGRLSAAGWHVLPGRLPIIPVIIGLDAATMALAARLAEAGILATGIRPPTVPEGTSRIRLTVTAAHTPQDIATIAEAFGRPD